MVKTHGWGGIIVLGGIKHVRIQTGTYQEI
jgi:hypothetical protein